jgi:hypothetical protein
LCEVGADRNARLGVAGIGVAQRDYLDFDPVPAEVSTTPYRLPPTERYIFNQMIRRTGGSRQRIWASASVVDAPLATL